VVAAEMGSRRCGHWLVAFLLPTTEDTPKENAADGWKTWLAAASQAVMVTKVRGLILVQKFKSDFYGSDEGDLEILHCAVITLELPVRRIVGSSAMGDEKEGRKLEDFEFCFCTNESELSRGSKSASFLF